MPQTFLAKSIDQTLGHQGIGDLLLKSMDTRVLTFEEGEYIHHMGDEITSLYCVIEGWLTAVCDLVNGERQLVNFYVPYDIVGFEYLGRATATSDLLASKFSKVVQISIPSFKTSLKTSDVATMAITSVLSRKYAALQARLQIFAKGDAMAKLVHFLYGLRSRQIRNQQSEFNIIKTPLRQQDIADALGMTNVTVSRLFTRLEDMGCIKFETGAIEILDFEKLMAQAEGISETAIYVDEFN